MKEQNWVFMPKFPGQFPLSTDSVLLADFVSVSGTASIADLGAGSGTIGLLLCARHRQCRVDGIELQERSVQLAQEIIRLNQMEDRVSVRCGDLRQIEDIFPANRCDAVVSNPPYFPADSGKTAAEDSLAIARTELCCTLSDVCRAAAYLLRYGKPFYLVHRPERLCDLMTELRRYHLEPKRLRFVCHRPSLAPSLVLIESRLGGNPGLTVLPTLLLHEEDGSETAEYRRIYGFGGI